MSLIALVQEFDGQEIGEDKHGNPILGKLLPAASKEELRELAGLIPCTIPSHVRDLLETTRGIVPSLHSVDFTGLSLKDLIELEDLCPNGLPIAGDEYGNFWVVDLFRSSKDWGPVFYVCHDPPVMVLQAKTFEEFILQLIEKAQGDANSKIDFVHDQAAHRIYGDNPLVKSFEEASLPGDRVLSGFAASLTKEFEFIDLRKAQVGDGFNWGRYGADTVIKRSGEDCIFACKKKPGFWQKLFGRN